MAALDPDAIKKRVRTDGFDVDFDGEPTPSTIRLIHQKSGGGVTIAVDAEGDAIVVSAVSNRTHSFPPLRLRSADGTSQIGQAIRRVLAALGISRTLGDQHNRRQR